MKVELEDVLFWMDAIRNSEDRYRTLESFWKGQVHSKQWLIEHLEEFQREYWGNIVIYGGWNGVLASLIFNSRINVGRITSVDIDPACEEIANTMNKTYEMRGKFRAVTADMVDYVRSADVVINTSCEHITQEQYDQWLDNQPNDALIVLQGNNYFDLEEHVRCAKDIDDFTKQCNIKPFFRGTHEHPKYNRFMIIGKKK
jgi:spermidine synthase